MPSPIVSAHHLTKHFGDFVAVDNVSFNIYPKEIIGYLGPNGSGKTTTIRMLLGLLLPTSGSSQVKGFNSVSETEKVRANVGYMSQKFALYDELSVIENIEFYAGVYGVKDNGHISHTLSRVGLNGHENDMASDLAVGFRQRLALATAIVHNPSVLFLDEPTSGVDPLARRLFWDLIYELVDENMTAMVTTHYMDEAEYCQRVCIMRQGKLLAEDSPSDLKTKIFTGSAWDVQVEQLFKALSAFEKSAAVIQSSFLGNYLRVITEKDITPEDIKKILSDSGVSKATISPSLPSLEDVFLFLSK